MYCEMCQSGNQAEFTSESMVHFTGVKNGDDLGRLAFWEISICMDCGFSRFTTPEGVRVGQFMTSVQ